MTFLRRARTAPHGPRADFARRIACSATCRVSLALLGLCMVGCIAQTPVSGRRSDSQSCIPTITKDTACKGQRCGICTFKDDCNATSNVNLGLCNTSDLAICESESCESENHECGTFKNSCNETVRCGRCLDETAICGVSNTISRLNVCCTPTAAEKCPADAECGFKDVASCKGQIACGANEGACPDGEQCNEKTFKCENTLSEPGSDPPAEELKRIPNLEVGKNLCPIGTASTATECTPLLSDLCTDECPSDASRCRRDPRCDPNGWRNRCIDAYLAVYAADAARTALINKSCQ